MAHLLLELCRDGQASSDELTCAFRDALNCDAMNPELLAEASQSAWARGDRDSARDYLRRGMELDPEQANLRALCGLIAMSEGHFEEAEQEFEAAIRRNWHGNFNGYYQALAVWAACLVKLDRPSHAEQLARMVVVSRPDWPAPRYTRAYALAMLGRRSEAETEYRELIALCAGHPLAAEAERELRKLEPERNADGRR
jgi:Flp pilus assembly protein TadD